jgi:hypothetical protein
MASSLSLYEGDVDYPAHHRPIIYRAGKAVLLPWARTKRKPRRVLRAAA